MKLLLHICCAPCAIYPIEILRADNITVFGFFYKHNIHPYAECKKREDTLMSYARTIDLSVIYQDGYNPEEFLRNVVFRESSRCIYCYHDRLTATAKVAKRGKFNGFSSTLLYSKFQQHDQIKSIGEAVGAAVGVPFLYKDFRIGWKRGIEVSKQIGLYRQQYCGCIYSEKERFFPSRKVHV